MFSKSIFGWSSLVSYLGTIFSFLLMVFTVFSLPPITTLSQSTAMVVKTPSYQASIEAKRALDLEKIKKQADIELEKSQEKQPKDLAITGSCSDPIGWVEDTGSKSLNGISYWVPRNKSVPASHKPSTNPSSFVVVTCNSTDKINYLDTVDNKFKVIDNRIIAKTTKIASQDYSYINSANDFQAYFHSDPNMGWLFQSKETTVKVSKVGVSVEVEKGNSTSSPTPTIVPLATNKPVLKGNTITYPEILPNVDLQYIVTNRGVNKFFVLKNKEALNNKIKEINYVLDSGTNVTLVEETKEYQEVAKTKEATKAKELKELKVTTKTPTKETTPSKEIDPTTKVRVKSLEIQDKKSSNKVTINKPVTFDSKPVVVGSLEPKEVSKETAKETILENNFTLSPDNKTVNIILDQESQDYFTSPERIYPILIDPETLTTGPLADTWVNSNTPNSVRTSEFSNRAHLVVGGSASIVGGYVAKARTWLKFPIPNNVESGSSVISAQVWLKQYDGVGGMKMEIKNACNFDEWTLNWNNQPCIYEKRAEIMSENYVCSTPGCGKSIGSSDIGGLVRDYLNINGREMRLELNDDAENSMLNRKAVFCSGDGRTDNHPCNNTTGQAPVLQIVYDTWKNYAPVTPNIFSPSPNSQQYLGCSKSATGFDNSFSAPTNTTSNTPTPTNTQISKLEGNCNQDKMSFGIGLNNINDGNNGDRDEPYLTLDTANLQNGWFSNLSNREQISNNRDAWKYFNTYSGVFGSRAFTGDRYGVNSGWSSGSDRLDNRMAIVDKSAPVQVSPQVIPTTNNSVVDYVNGVINTNQSNSIPTNGVALVAATKININNQGGITYLGRSPLDPNNTNLQVTAPVPTYSDDLLSRVRIKNKENTAVLDISNGILNNGTSINIWGNNSWIQSTGFVVDGNRLRTVAYNNNTNYCLDSSAGTTIGSTLHLWECHQGYNQDWFYDTVTNQIKMLSRQDLCWEQSRTYDNSSPVSITLQACSIPSNSSTTPAPIKPTQQFILENLEEIRLKLKDTDRSIQHNGNDGNIGATMKMSYDGLDWQKFYYSSLTKEIRNHSSNHCLTSPTTPNQGVSIQGCNNNAGASAGINPNQQWEFKDGVVRSTLPNTNLCLGVVGNKWQVDIAVVVVTCNPADGNQQIYKESVFKRYFPTLGLQTQSAIVRLTSTTTNPTTGLSTTTPVNPNDFANYSLLPYQTSPAIQYSNNPNSTNPKDKILNQEDVFGITTKGIDRITTQPSQFNEGYWGNIAKFRLDIDKPIVKDTAIVQVGNNLSITTTTSDKNLALVQVELIQNKDGLRTTVGKESSCSLKNGDTVVAATQLVNPCNITKTPFSSNGDNKLSFQLNLGTSTSTATLPSGIYEIQVRSYDRAGNVSIDQATNNLVEIDRDPAKIAITYPVNQAWVNTPTLTLQGSVAGYNYDASGNASMERNRDVTSLTIQNLIATPTTTTTTTTPITTPTNPTTIPINDNKNWSTTVSLQEGNNQFRLETTDKSGNKSNWIGDTSTISTATTNNKQGKQDKWNINLDTKAPIVTALNLSTVSTTTATATATTPATTTVTPVPSPTSSNPVPTISSNNPRFDFWVSDVPANATATTTTTTTPTGSGLNETINPKGYFINLINTSNPASPQNIPLYFDDTVVSDPNPAPRLASNLSCSSGTSRIIATQTLLPNNPVSCNISLANLINGNYRLEVKARDRAGNTSAIQSYPFTVNSFQQGTVNLDIIPRTETQANLLVTPIDKATTTAGYTIINAVSTPYSKNLICVNSPELKAQNIAKVTSNPTINISTLPTRPLYTTPTASVPNPINCDQTVEVTANMIGQIASGLVLPVANSQYSISVVRLTPPLQGAPYQGAIPATTTSAINPDTVVASTRSNITTISYSTPASFNGLEVTSSLDGLNTADEVKAVLAGTRSIESLKKTQIKVTVPRGTEALDIDYGDLTNLNIQPNTILTTTDQAINGYTGANGASYGSFYNGAINVNYQRIAVINDLPEERTTLNPTKDASIKKNQYALNNIKNGNDLSRKELFNPCNQESCTWLVNYYLPYYQAGGKYDLRVRMYKGESIVEATRTIEVNGIIPTVPTLLRADKSTISNQCRYQQANQLSATATTPITTTPTINQTANSTFSVPSNCLEQTVIPNSSILGGTLPTIYTNSDRNKLIIGADPSTPLLIQVTRPDKTVEYLSRRTNASGVLYLDYYPISDGAYQFALVQNGSGIYTPSFILNRDT